MKTTTKLAISNLQTNKSRTVLISISVMLTTMLLTVIALSGYGLVKENKINAARLYGEFYGGYIRVNGEILEKMKLHGEFLDVGKMTNFATVSLEEADGILSYIDETAKELGHVSTSEGVLPVKENEIAGQKGFFEKTGLMNPRIGDKVSLSYRIGDSEVMTADFVISGFMKEGEKNDLAKVYGAYVSESFFEDTVPETDRSYNVVFKVKDGEELNEDQMQEKIEDLASELGLDKTQVVVNNAYLMWLLDPGLETIGICSVIAILVVLFSVLVIYSIFYVGIIQKVQEYGKLRAIGTTKKQIKKILLREGMILAGIGTAAGLLLGTLVAEFFFRWLLGEMYESLSMTDVETVSAFNLPLMLLAAVISFAAVYISLKKPMRIAAGISPVEAMRYQEDSAKGKGTRNGYSSINVMRLTMSNLARNKKRTLTTIFTMGLSCVMFVVIANVAGNMDAEYDARTYVEKGDFYITLDCRMDDTAYPENNLNHVQQQDLMSDEWLDEIRDIDGVTKVETRKAIRALRENVNGVDDELYTQVTALSKEDYEKLDMEQGILNYDSAEKNNEIIFGANYWMDTYGYKIGDEVKLTFFDGDKEIPMTFTLTGSTEARSMFILTEEQLEAMNITENMTIDTWVSCDKDKLESVQSTLKQMTEGSEYYEMNTYQDAYKLSNMNVIVTKGALYALLGIIGVIGFMNMANTLITSIITRRRELGILQAIGMTKKQLSHMLQMEGLVFTVGTLLVSLSLGNVLGYLAWMKCKAEHVFGISTYGVPVAELLVMTGILLVLQMVLSGYMSGYLQKEALIERIRHQE
ncbi:MAG: ABC transporter permease [Lachnospiraceae bacterium]|nr:ABC transporter permease [Lachnospiraceae bacterium]